MNVLNKQEIERLIKEKGLISGFIDSAVQCTPNGFDLTVGSLTGFASSGALDFSNKERVLPQEKELVLHKKDPADRWGWWELPPGAYKVKTNETVTLPKDLVAVAFSRSSLLRIGAFTQTGVWDAGFNGKSEFILVVQNHHGIRIKQNARLVQLVFMRMNETAVGYNGVYQNSV